MEGRVARLLISVFAAHRVAGDRVQYIFGPHGAAAREHVDEDAHSKADAAKKCLPARRHAPAAQQELLNTKKGFGRYGVRRTFESLAAIRICTECC